MSGNESMRAFAEDDPRVFRGRFGRNSVIDESAQTLVKLLSQYQDRLHTVPAQLIAGTNRVC